MFVPFYAMSAKDPAEPYLMIESRTLGGAKRRVLTLEGMLRQYLDSYHAVLDSNPDPTDPSSAVLNVDWMGKQIVVYAQIWPRMYPDSLAGADIPTLIDTYTKDAKKLLEAYGR